MNQYFPWKTFLRFFFAQLFGYNLLFGVIVGSVYFSLSHQWSEFELGFAFEYLIRASFAFFILSACFAALTSWRFCLPLNKVIQKLRSIARKRAVNGEFQDDIFEESLDEFSQIDVSINRIDKKYRKKKEQLEREREENQAFMSSVQEGLVSIGPDGQLLYFNSQFASLFIDQGQFQLQQLQGQSLSLTDVIRVPEVVQAFRRVVETGQNQKISVKISTRLSHQLHYFSISLAPLLKSSRRDLFSVIGVFHDISDIKKAEQIRIEFVGNASHELRTPLTSVKGYVETIKGDFLENRFDHIPKFLEIVGKNVDRLIDLVTDLLSLSSLESNPQLKTEEVVALQVSEFVVNELNFMASEKQIKIFIQGNIPPFQADTRKVEQVLRNLVSNAIKYIGHGGEVRILWEQLASGDVRLIVQDNGPGIDEVHLSRLFERFYRIDRGRAREDGGTGLGLAIVKHIMQSHGGVVLVRSRLGQGSEFECIFPQQEKVL